MLDAWIIEQIERDEREHREREREWRRQLPLEQPLPGLERPDRETVERDTSDTETHQRRGTVVIDYSCDTGVRFRL